MASNITELVIQQVVPSPSDTDVVPIAPPEPAPAEKVAPRPKMARLLAASAFLGIHLGALSIFFVPTTWEAVALCAFFYSLRVFGLTAGYHRLFAHRGYKTSRWFQFLIGCFGASSLQRGPIWWAGHHRVHHKYSDQKEDVHSPITESFWWSHIGWVLSPRDVAHDGWDQMKDWKKYPELRWLERFDVVPGVLLAVFCYLVAGWSGLAWSFFLSTTLVYHVTFCVNSVCHLLGRRRFETTDRSRNNWWVALLTFGEGWHNNHHHYPSAARQGFKWWEIDISYSTLVVLSWFGIVWDLRQPTERALNSKLIVKDQATTTPA